VHALDAILLVFPAWDKYQRVQFKSVSGMKISILKFNKRLFKYEVTGRRNRQVIYKLWYRELC